MVLDKSETSKNQENKKSKKSSAHRSSDMERTAADAKALYKDLDLSSGRNLRKRAAPSVAKASPKKKKVHNGTKATSKVNKKDKVSKKTGITEANKAAAV